MGVFLLCMCARVCVRAASPLPANKSTITHSLPPPPPLHNHQRRNKKYFILCDDLPRVEVLKELCETIYLARMYKNLALEEELYRELIDIYRRPESGIFQRTGPYRHWLREADEDKSDYDRIVREGLEKYR